MPTKHLRCRAVALVRTADTVRLSFGAAAPSPSSPRAAWSARTTGWAERATPRSEPAVEVAGLPHARLEGVGAARWFGQHRVFSGLDLSVPGGVRVFLGGGNGSGKTTLLRCLAGTLTLTAGRVTIGGAPAGSAAARRSVGLCLAPEQGLYGHLTGAQNLLLAARIRLARRAAREAVE